MDNVVVAGTSGHAKVVIDIIEKEARYKIVGLLDPKYEVGEEVFGYPVLGVEDELSVLVDEQEISGIIVAVGDNGIRAQVARRITERCPTLKFVNSIHPGAMVARDVSIGNGTVVMAGAVVNPCCKIGEFCIVNTKASLDHDSTMGDFAQLAPGVTTGGNVVIGEFSTVCLGATVKQGIQIGSHSIIGAGAVVLENIGSYQMAYGVPAKSVRSLELVDNI